MEKTPAKRFKRSGAYYRRKKNLLKSVENESVATNVVLTPDSAKPKSRLDEESQSVHDNVETVDTLEDEFIIEDNENEEYYSPSEGDDITDIELLLETEEPFEVFLRNWALRFNITHYALKPLMEKCRKEFSAKLPLDPRTLMRKYY